MDVNDDAHQTDPAEVTALLGEIRAGEDGASGKLAELVYRELRGLARAMMSENAAGHTLQPTALVHEAWLKLVGHLGAVQDRPHFFAIAATAMRQVLADHARAQQRLKRGGEARRITFSEGDIVDARADFDLLEFSDALEKLAQISERQARVVELRLLGSLSIKETARFLGVSDRTVKTDWQMARAWLLREMSEA